MENPLTLCENTLCSVVASRVHGDWSGSRPTLDRMLAQAAHCVTLFAYVKVRVREGTSMSFCLFQGALCIENSSFTFSWCRPTRVCIGIASALPYNAFESEGLTQADAADVSERTSYGEASITGCPFELHYRYAGCLRGVTVRFGLMCRPAPPFAVRRRGSSAVTVL